MLDIQCIECRECISKWHIDEKKAQETYERALKVMNDYSVNVLDSGVSGILYILCILGSCGGRPAYLEPLTSR